MTSQPFPGIRIPTIRTLRPGLHLLETEVEDFDVRAAVLVGAERAVVWDTLAHPAQMRDVAGLLRGRADLTGAATPPAGAPALTVVYSHADWDHAWGTAGLADVEAVVASEETLERFATDVPEELRTRREMEPDVWDTVRLVPPDVTFTEHLTLDLGDATLQLHALAGHTPDSIVGWIPEWGVLLAGDAVETPLPEVNDAAAVTRWIAGLRTWCADERVRVVVPAHGRVGGRELLDYSRVYLELLVQGRLPMYADIPLPAFYQEVHARNLDVMSGAANRQRSPT